MLGLASSQVQVQERKDVRMQESHGLGLGPALLARSRHVMRKLTPCLVSDCRLLSASPPFPLCPTPTQAAGNAWGLPPLGLEGGSTHARP